MVKNHIKRIAAPRTWNILRKESKFVTRQNPGSHSNKFSVALNTLLKDMLNLSKSTKETKFVLTKQEVLINNKRRKDYKAQAGLLDLVSIPSIKKTYRITIDSKGMLKAKEVKENSDLILKVTGKTKIRSGKTQINTLNGYNIIVSESESKKYKIGDTIIANGEDGKIKSHHSLEKGAHVLIITGKHSCKYGEVVSIDENIISIKTDKETFETNKNYALVITKDKKSELD